MSYAIRFEFPDKSLGFDTCYAGIHKGGAGFAPTLKTAELYDTADIAERMLKNAYGGYLARWGKVIQVVNESERPYEVVKR